MFLFFLQEIPSYNYQYGVRDAYGNNFGHGETRDGYNTKGEYFVNLPDGRLQRVSYVVSGDSGYQAQVSYVGEARYPAYTPKSSYAPKPYYAPKPGYGPAPVYNPKPFWG